jgi:hypothetical protein
VTVTDSKADSFSHTQVTCEAKYEKFVLQAKSRAYFCIERDPATDELAPVYHVGFAIGREPPPQSNEFSTQFLGKPNFPFEPRKIVFSTESLEEAFELTDVLIGMMVTDGRLRAM